jgi:hypothetical protein
MWVAPRDCFGDLSCRGAIARHLAEPIFARSHHPQGKRSADGLTCHRDRGPSQSFSAPYANSPPSQTPRTGYAGRRPFGPAGLATGFGTAPRDAVAGLPLTSRGTSMCLVNWSSGLLAWRAMIARPWHRDNAVHWRRHQRAAIDSLLAVRMLLSRASRGFLFRSLRPHKIADSHQQHMELQLRILDLLCGGASFVGQLRPQQGLVATRHDHQNRACSVRGKSTTAARRGRNARGSLRLYPPRPAIPSFGDAIPRGTVSVRQENVMARIIQQ